MLFVDFKGEWSLQPLHQENGDSGHILGGAPLRGNDGVDVDEGLFILSLQPLDDGAIREIA